MTGIICWESLGFDELLIPIIYLLGAARSYCDKCCHAEHFRWETFEGVEWVRTIFGIEGLG
jgi:hypothetical protein